MMTCAETPLAVAEMTEGPAVFEEIVTDAEPSTAVVAVAALSVPRVALKFTVWPAIGVPEDVHTIVIVAVAPILTLALAAGELKVNESLLTETVCVAFRPPA